MTHEDFLQTFPALVPDYKPAPEVVSQIGNLRLLIVVGPSGAGKTTVMHRLDVPYVVPDTSRPPRPEEKEDFDYHFRTDYDTVLNQIKRGDFVQVAVGPGGDFYSTLASSYPKDDTAVMAAVADVVPLFRQLGFKETISAFITPPSYEEWMRRLSNHPAGQADIAKRLKEAKRSFAFALNDPHIHFIDTENLDIAIRQTRDLLQGKIHADLEQKARQAAQEVSDSLN